MTTFKLEEERKQWLYKYDKYRISGYCDQFKEDIDFLTVMVIEHSIFAFVYFGGIISTFRVLDILYQQISLAKHCR